MPEANTNAVASKLRAAIDAQEKVKDAAKAAAQQPASPPRTAQERPPAEGGPK